ncbi:hypothetical protein WJX72_010122 [[Myrmecia] bisecta]|uniref:Exocyst complex component Sec8 n=1 Tax=[Myrmecia] bisecta TaxID=41462 RepID=A0AAW1PQ66_9CHLO
MKYSGSVAAASAAMSGFGQAGRVDWELVDEELDKIPSEFKDPRFDSLRHVLNILSAVDAEAALEELRSQRDRIEEMVDDVVQGYHNGFNKAIHNYSQILHLFADSKGQVDTLRSSLEDAKRRLGAQSRNLQQQWRRSVTLGDIVRLLTDIQSVVDIPQRVQKLEEAKDWGIAVGVLLDGCNKLARREAAKVGALRDIKKEMSVRRASLQKQIVHEMEQRIYLTGIRELSNLMSDNDEGESGSKEGQASSSSLHGRTHSMGDVLAAFDAARDGSPIKERPRKPADHSKHRRTNTLQVDAAQNAAAKHRRANTITFNDAPGHHRRTPTLSGAAQKAPPPPDTGAQGSGIRILVDCIVQIGGVAEAQLTIRRHMAAQIRNVILRALQSAQGAAEGGAADGLAASAGGLGAGKSANGASGSSRAEVSAMAQKVTERVFDHCLQALRNLVNVLRLLATARAPPASAGLELLIAQHAEEGGRTGEVPPLVSPAYVRKECEYAWECMQKECQKLLAELLHAPNLQPGAAHANGNQNGAGWLQSMAEQGKRARDPGQLTFSFDVQVQGMNATTLLQREKSVAQLEVQDHATLLNGALGGNPGGAYLTAVLYRPVVQFVDGAVHALDSLEGGATDQQSTGGWLSTISLAAAADDKDKARRQALRQLRSWMETFVTEEFLPEVYVDFRGRCTGMLEDPEAFKARARLRSAYNAEASKGRPLLPAALSAEKMIDELLDWASLMPMFATHLTGVVENILGRVLDAFQARMLGLLGSSTCKTLAENAQLALYMANDASASLAGDPVAFFVGKTSDSVDAFVSSILSSGFSSGDDNVEADIFARILQERPVSSEQLLSISGGDSNRLTNLAALSDSLDYIADVIVRSGTPQQASPAKEGPSTLAEAGGLPRIKSKHMRRASSGAVCLTEGLAHLMDRYRALAGHCLRALRLEMHLLLIHYLQELPHSSYVCEEEDTKEVDECIGALSRFATRAEEDLSPYLPPTKRSYVFGSLASAAARMVMWLLPELREMNQHGVARMCRMLAVLQPALSALGATGGFFRPEASRQFEKARTYYGLVTYKADDLLKAAAEKPTRFTAAEYTALLQVNFVDRPVTVEQRAQLARIVNSVDRKARPSTSTDRRTL